MSWCAKGIEVRDREEVGEDWGKNWHTLKLRLQHRAHEPELDVVESHQDILRRDSLLSACSSDLICAVCKKIMISSSISIYHFCAYLSSLAGAKNRMEGPRTHSPGG